MRLGCQARSFGEGVYPDEAAFLSVVGQIGELGFEGFEANWMNMERYFATPEVFVSELGKAGIELIGPHYGGAMWDPSTLEKMTADFERIIPFVSTVGGSYVVISSNVPRGDWKPEDIMRPIAQRLNELGSICDDQPLCIAYHNHSWEAIGNGLEQLADLVDPERVTFAFDTGNHIDGGGDPVQALRSIGSMIDIVHLKDYGAGAYRALGEGELDLPETKNALREIGFHEWLVLEEETKPADARGHVSRCLEILRGFTS